MFAGAPTCVGQHMTPSSCKDDNMLITQEKPEWSSKTIRSHLRYRNPKTKTQDLYTDPSQPTDSEKLHTRLIANTSERVVQFI